MVTGVRTNTSLPRDKERGFDFVLSVIDISVTLEQICQRGVKEVWSHSSLVLVENQNRSYAIDSHHFLSLI
jgi:hypothetical protein